MSQFTYNGEEERVFPTLSIVVNKGDTFEAPDDFTAYGVSSGSTKKSTASAVAPIPSDTPDITVDEVK